MERFRAILEYVAEDFPNNLSGAVERAFVTCLGGGQVAGMSEKVKEIVSAACPKQAGKSSDYVEVVVKFLLEAKEGAGVELRGMLEGGGKEEERGNGGGKTIADLGEEDDEEDEDGKAEAGKAAAVAVSLRGSLKVNAESGKVVWAGKWGMTEEDFKADNVPKFRYEMEKKGEAAATKDPSSFSGTYTGTFLVKNEAAPGGFERVDEANVTLKLEKDGEKPNFKVTGAGQNLYGPFSLEGEFDPSNQKITVSKRYNAAAKESTIESDDEDDEEDSDAENGEADEDVAGELNELKTSAEIPVEELRAKYGESGEDKDKKKKQKR